MHAAEHPKTKWHKYLSRVVLFFVLITFVGCGDAECRGLYGLPCHRTVVFEDQFSLTEKSLSKKVNPPVKACIYEECSYRICYQYKSYSVAENASSASFPNATQKDKPAVTVNIGTSEHGTLAGSSKTPAVYDANTHMWVVSGEMHFPVPKNDMEDSPPVALTMNVSIKKPLIQLGGKTPTISLPVIGPILGPAPKEVYCTVFLQYATSGK